MILSMHISGIANSAVSLSGVVPNLNNKESKVINKYSGEGGSKPHEDD